MPNLVLPRRLLSTNLERRYILVISLGDEKKMPDYESERNRGCYRFMRVEGALNAWLKFLDE